MIVATAATLFIHNIPLEGGEQAALAIKPFAGELASYVFAFGILNAGFMGFIIVALSTAYAFTEFFGFSGSLDAKYQTSRSFYLIYLAQLIIAAIIVMFPTVKLFSIAVTIQSVNAMMLPLIFYYLIKLTNNSAIMGKYINNSFQKYFAIVCTVIIIIASIANLFFLLIK